MTELEAGYDAIVIGAGVIGCSIARALARAGARTLNIDALPAAGCGSTSYSSAIVRPFYSYPEGVALAHESRSRWLEWRDFLEAEEGPPLAEYRDCGMLILPPGGDVEAIAPNIALLDRFSVRYEILGPEEMARRWPDMSLASWSPPRRPDDPAFGAAPARAIEAALFIRDAGYVNDPQLAARNLAAAATRAGAAFLFNAKVVEIATRRGRVCGVRLADGREIAAPVLVNAAGPHSAKVNALAGVACPVATRAMRHEIATLAGPDAFIRNGTVVGDADAGAYFRPDAGADLLVGGLDPDCDAPEWVDPDAYNDQLTEQWTAQVWRAGLRLPALAIPNRARGAVGLYDATPDWIPVYDRSSLTGYYLAIGTSGNQFKNAPVIGDLMAALIAACKGGRDHDKTPVSLRLPALGAEVSLGAFSRNREAASTSGTVLA
ncbi:MAG: FAD-binding oxidoreductase [Parvularculaceae bacterium]